MDNISIRTNANPRKLLMDRRVGRYGLTMGTIEGICRQYGISISESNGYTILTAPRKRLQIIAEKLHFSGIRFMEVPTL